MLFLKVRSSARSFLSLPLLASSCHAKLMTLLAIFCMRATACSRYLALLSAALIFDTASSLSPQSNQKPHPRSKFLRDFSSIVTFGLGGTKPGFTMATSPNEQSTSINQVVYEPITIDMLGEEVPVAAWFRQLSMK
jgi:hypothetical protein